MDDVAYHAWLLEMWRDAEDASERPREKAARDIDYYDGKQLTEAEVKALKLRGQPPIVLNGIRDKIDYYSGLEKSQRTQPNALPRTPSDEQEAQAATDALRFVTDQNKFDRVRSAAFGDILKAGWGGYELTVKPAKQVKPGAPQYRITIKRCAWDRMVWDPYSCELDFSDANYLGMVLWMDRSEAVRQYGEAAGQVFDETCAAEAQSTYGDKPYQAWVQRQDRQRIRIVQLYHVNPDDGEWDYCDFTRGGILQDGPSPWTGEDGERINPYAWGTAYIDRENNRYGVIRDMIDPQDERNKRRSKALHLFTTRQTFGRRGIMGDMSVKDMKRELSRADGHIEFAIGAEWMKDFGVIPTGDMASGQMELLQQVEGVFQVMGPNAALQGKKSGNDSGRALLAQQQGGSVQVGTVTDTLKQMDYDAYRKMWLLIRYWWTGEIWLRVTKDEQNLKWVGLNTPVMGPNGLPLVDSTTGQPLLDNDVSGLDVDIDIEDAPSGGTLADEQFQMLIQLKQMDQKGEIPFSYIIAAAPNLRNKQDLVQATRQNENQPPNPIEQGAAVAKVQGLQADANLKNAQAARTKAEIGKTQADTGKAIADARKTVVDTHGSAMNSVQTGFDIANALQNPLVSTPPGYTVAAQPQPGQ